MSEAERWQLIAENERELRGGPPEQPAAEEAADLAQPRVPALAAREGRRLGTVFPDTPGPAAHASTGVKRTNITGRSPGH